MSKNKIQSPHPIGLLERLLWAFASGRTSLGRSCFRKAMRRQRSRHQNDFEMVLRELGAGDLCIDLGANVGEISRKIADTGAGVIAFEPDPDTFSILKSRLGDRPNVRLIEAAAGTEALSLELRRSRHIDDNIVRYSQSASVVRTDSEIDPQNSVLVSQIDFVSFVKNLNQSVKLLKIDIEGSEWELVDTLLDSNVLDAFDFIFLETHEWMSPRENIDQIISFTRRAKCSPGLYFNPHWH